MSTHVHAKLPSTVLPIIPVMCMSNNVINTEAIFYNTEVCAIRSHAMCGDVVELSGVSVLTHFT
jgi:hypothetical protein